MSRAPTEGDLGEVHYLTSARAVRDRAEAMYALGLSGSLESWVIDEGALGSVVDRVERVTRAAYPDVKDIPYHSRFRHFGAGGVDRLAVLDDRLGGLSRDERLAARFELVITSVLLDAGAGPQWSYRDPEGRIYTRSEGLAVASYDWFVSGGLASEPGAPRADAAVLSRVDEASLARAFQVAPTNPLVGISGRAGVLRRLGDAVNDGARYFGAEQPRLGRLAATIECAAAGRAVRAAEVLDAVLGALGSIWPGRERLHGVYLGDVWQHPAVGRVPFHKLSQWLTYSLCEALLLEGTAVTGFDELTGLAEYRNGGLFVDAGVLVPKHPSVLAGEHDVSSPVVVEWRALTVALLDRTAALLRERLGLSVEELPLAKVLEGGTWSAGRQIAREKRADGTPPLRVKSDGTVF